MKTERYFEILLNVACLSIQKHLNSKEVEINERLNKSNEKLFDQNGFYVGKQKC